MTAFIKMAKNVLFHLLMLMSMATWYCIYHFKYVFYPRTFYAVTHGINSMPNKNCSVLSLLQFHWLMMSNTVVIFGAQKQLNGRNTVAWPTLSCTWTIMSENIIWLMQQFVHTGREEERMGGLQGHLFMGNAKRKSPETELGLKWHSHILTSPCHL